MSNVIVICFVLEVSHGFTLLDHTWDVFCSVILHLRWNRLISIRRQTLQIHSWTIWMYVVPVMHKAFRCTCDCRHEVDIFKVTPVWNCSDSSIHRNPCETQVLQEHSS
eukprot:s73_g5.t1